MMPYPQPMITKMPPSWSVHEVGSEPIHGVKVIRWTEQPNELWQCEVHGYWLPGDDEPCTHIKQAKEDADATRD